MASSSDVEDKQSKILEETRKSAMIGIEGVTKSSSFIKKALLKKFDAESEKAELFFMMIILVLLC